MKDIKFYHNGNDKFVLAIEENQESIDIELNYEEFRHLSDQIFKASVDATRCAFSKARKELRK